MSKSIPALLLDHYQQVVTTKSNLLKITALNGTVLGVAAGDRDRDFDDGFGEITYQAAIGVDTVALETSAGLEVDNSEALMLLADAGPFTAQAIEAGLLDYAEYVVYRVNWADLTQGFEIKDRGTVGIVRNVNGLSAVVELRSLPQLLKQNYGELYSITCRARFGSGGGAACLTRCQCGFDAESLWQNHSVTSVGSEVYRVFTANATPAVNGPNGALTFVPGLVQWLTGDNAGLTSEIEAITGAEISLRFGTPFTIQATDTFKTRPDCDKTWETCRDDFANQLNFCGEPKIPLVDEVSQSIPSSTPITQPTPNIPAPEVDPPTDPVDPPPVPPAPSPDSAIVNPGFESGESGWDRGAGWEVTSRRPRSGSKSAEYLGFGGGSAGGGSPIRQTKHVPVTPSTSITAQCYVLRDTVAGVTAAVVLRWFDASDVLISESVGNFILSGSAWQISTVTDTAPGSAAFVAVGAKSFNGDFRHRAYVDDFSWNF